MTEEPFEGWCVVEVMGHQRYAGYASEVRVAGAEMLRVDVPAVEEIPAYSKLIAPGSLFAVTPVNEDLARQIAGAIRKRPIDIYIQPLAQATEDPFWDE